MLVVWVSLSETYHYPLFTHWSLTPDNASYISNMSLLSFSVSRLQVSGLESGCLEIVLQFWRHIPVRYWENRLQRLTLTHLIQTHFRHYRHRAAFRVGVLMCGLGLLSLSDCTYQIYYPLRFVNLISRYRVAYCKALLIQAPNATGH